MWFQTQKIETILLVPSKLIVHRTLWCLNLALFSLWLLAAISVSWKAASDLFWDTATNLFVIPENLNMINFFSGRPFSITWNYLPYQGLALLYLHHLLCSLFLSWLWLFHSLVMAFPHHVEKPGSGWMKSKVCLDFYNEYIIEVVGGQPRRSILTSGLKENMIFENSRPKACYF